jgi:hypothetical protein
VAKCSYVLVKTLPSLACQSCQGIFRRAESAETTFAQSATHNFKKTRVPGSGRGQQTQCMIVTANTTMIAALSEPMMEPASAKSEA